MYAYMCVCVCVSIAGLHAITRQHISNEDEWLYVLTKNGNISMYSLSEAKY